MNACHRFTAISPETLAKESLFGIPEQDDLADEAVYPIGGICGSGIHAIFLHSFRGGGGMSMAW